MRGAVAHSGNIARQAAAEPLCWRAGACSHVQSSPQQLPGPAAGPPVLRPAAPDFPCLGTVMLVLVAELSLCVFSSGQGSPLPGS